MAMPAKHHQVLVMVASALRPRQNVMHRRLLVRLMRPATLTPLLVAPDDLPTQRFPTMRQPISLRR
jgi:hypothetical protein